MFESCGEMCRRRWTIVLGSLMLTFAGATTSSSAQGISATLDQQIKDTFHVDRFDLQDLRVVAGDFGSLEITPQSTWNPQGG